MICSTLSGMLAIKHPTLGVLVREDGMVFNITVGGYPTTYAWTKGSLKGATGYRRVAVQRKRYRVHRLVAETFIPNPENKPTVDHINRIRDDNRVCNLRWATHKEQAENREYVVRKPSKYGVRKCENSSEYFRKYRDAHRDEIREYRKSHRAESREYTRKYRERKKLQDSQCN